MNEKKPFIETIPAMTIERRDRFKKVVNDIIKFEEWKEKSFLYRLFNPFKGYHIDYIAGADWIRRELIYSKAANTFNSYELQFRFNRISDKDISLGYINEEKKSYYNREEYEICKDFVRAIYRMLKNQIIFSNECY